MIRFEGLEPPAQLFADEHGLSITSGDVIPLSIAISLKRIADEITRDRLSDDVLAGIAGKRFGAAVGKAIEDALKSPLNQYGEGIGEAISGQLERSQR